MLPPDFKWVRQECSMVYGDTRWLYVGGRAVGMVSKTIQGQWFTLVNRHRDPKQWLRADCARLEQGTLWVERWATALADRLRQNDGTSRTFPTR